MVNCTVIDTFPAFCAFWSAARDKNTDGRIDGWQSDYLAPWPELLAKQQQCYTADGEDWRAVAAERVFPFLEERLPAMRTAHDSLLACCDDVCGEAGRRLGLALDVTFVVYVGIGCGAGWVTPYGGGPAVLFGLEMIAECGWEALESVRGLMAHEVGHVGHAFWRDEAGVGDRSGAWWSLYTEGFAQRCEHVVLGRETWHESAGLNDADWLEWCRRHRGRLARDFLAAADAGASVRPFFGSWYDIDGRRQCGYFLGHEAVKVLQGGMTPAEIARLDDPEAVLRPVLERFAAEGE